MLTKGDCWHGGGLFVSARSYWINDGYGHGVLLDTSELRGDLNHRPPGYFGGECPGVYYNRLIRDGWALLSSDEDGGADAVFEKQVGYGLRLRKFCFAEVGAPPGRGCYHDKHSLVDEQGQLVADFPLWQWAELDRRHLVWAETGKLFSAFVTPKGIKDQKELCDFSEMRFDLPNYALEPVSSGYLYASFQSRPARTPKVSQIIRNPQSEIPN